MAAITKEVHNMAISDAQRKARNKWDSEHMTLLSTRVRKEYANEVKQACKECNTTPSAIMRAAIDSFMAEYRQNKQG